MAAEDAGLDAVDDPRLDVEAAALQSEVEELRAYKRAVEEALGSLEDRSDAIVKTVDELESTTAEESQLLARIGGETGELKETIESIARGTQTANAASSRTEELAGTAERSAREVIDEIEEARLAARKATSELNDLHDTVSEIDEITAMIDDIADQTNLLALNASIEAARVGEGGEGFAVVADEVKSLAEQAQRQATEIDSIVAQVQEDTAETIDGIDDVERATETAVASVEDTLTDLKAIAESATETSENIERVAEASDEKTKRVGKLGRKLLGAVETMHGVSETVDDLQESATRQREQVVHLNDLESEGTEVTDGSNGELT